MPTTNEIGLSDIHDNDTGQELILIIIISSVFLLTIFFICGFILYYYFNNKSKNKELYRLEREHQRHINSKISDMASSIHNIRERLDETFTFNKSV